MSDFLEDIKKYVGKINIAVVDDHDLFRSGIIALLKDYDDMNVVMQAGNGKEFLKQLNHAVEHTKQKQILPDVVLLDIQMPQMNGMETTVELQLAYPNMKIIILTMHNEEEFIFDLMNKGASGFLAKDKSVDMVVDAIYSVMEKGIYFNQQIIAAIVKGAQNKIKTPKLKEEINLSDRELEIIQLVCDQKTNKEIASLLELSSRTIESHRKAIAAKTSTKNTAGLVLYAIKNNLIENLN
jgi:DNA-binding NarL/FixJ family response regulator